MKRIFVISDLHLGGRPDEYDDKGRLVRTGFRTCYSYSALVDFIDWVQSHAKGTEQVELIINGDIIDFLAEDDYSSGVKTEAWTANEYDALEKFRFALSRSCSHSGRGVFDALREFALQPKCYLTLLLGNHDLELCLPKLRVRLIETLGGQSERLRFVYDGEAYTSGRLLVEHGNRYDRWNMIDYSGLRQERSVLSRGLPINESLRSLFYFVPPAGTHLVVSFMNSIKARYRFVDLLKPENDAVVPLLASLEPDYAAELGTFRDLATLATEFRHHKLLSSTMPAHYGDLGTPASVFSEVQLWTLFGANSEAVLPQFQSGDLGLPSLLQAELSSGSARFQEFVGGAWRRIRDQVTATTQRSMIEMLRVYGLGLPGDRLAQLHRALCRISRDNRAFQIENETEAYLKAATETACLGDFDVIIYGHTHLPKKVSIPRATGLNSITYLNTGTWCGVMHLPTNFSGNLELDRPFLEQFLNVLRSNDIAPLIRGYLSYAELLIELSSGKICSAELHSYCGIGNERAVPLSQYPCPAFAS